MVFNKDDIEIYNVVCCEYFEYLRVDYKFKNLRGNFYGFLIKKILFIWFNLEIEIVDLFFLICSV